MIGIPLVLLALLATSLSAVAGAAESGSAPVPSECLFSTPEAMDKLERDDPSLYGLSRESADLKVAYERELEERSSLDVSEKGGDEDGPDLAEEPVPAGAAIWSSMMVTRGDAKRLEEISTVRNDYGTELQKQAMQLAGDRFVGVTWSYVDGFVVSIVGENDIVSELQRAFPELPIKGHKGLVSSSTSAKNVAALSELSHDGFIAGSDASCGLTFVAFSKEALTERRLDQVLTPGTYQIVDLEHFGGAIPQPAAGKQERKAFLTGGLKIWTGAAPNTWCTSNVVGKKSSQQWLITAGHCMLGQSLTSSGGPGVHTLTGSHWYQGIGQTDHNRISMHTVQYMAFGGNHDIQVIRLRGNRTPTHLTHETVVPYNGGSADVFVNPTWWYWHLGFETTGTRVCQSGYTSNSPTCGLLTMTDASYDVEAPLWPYDATMTNVRWSTAMNACTGDSGGTVWADNNDDNIAGIVHGVGELEYTRIREGAPQQCGDGFYTSISSILNIGLNNPWGMP